MVYNGSNKTLSFIEKAEMAKLDLEREIKHQKSTQVDNGIGNIPQLENFCRDIDLMIKSKNYNPSYPRVIVDSWDFNSKLGKQLLDLYELYKRLG